MDSKKWIKSRTLWGNALMVVASIILKATGVDYLDAETQVGIIALVNMVFRIVTKTGLTL